MTWPCSQSTQKPSKPDLQGLDSNQPFGGRPAAGRVLGLPTGRFAGAALAAFGGLPTGRFAGAVGGAAAEGAGAMAARIVRSVSSSRSASAKTRRRAARVAASASASETPTAARFCFFPAMIGATLP
jgi:hypothetical protein